MASSWEEFVGSFRGPSYLPPLVDKLDHPVAALLSKWRDIGVPVHTTVESWTAEQKDKGIARGCHHSADEHADFLQEEMCRFSHLCYGNYELSAKLRDPLEGSVHLSATT